MPSNPSNNFRKLLPTSHRLLLEKIIREKMGTLRGDTLVIGAGYDPYREWLSSAKSICVTDISEKYAKIDKIADAHCLPFEDESFDAVIAVEVFEHLHSPHVAANELHRVLRKGGNGLISIPFLFRIHGDPFDFQRFTHFGLEILFKQFSNIKVSGFGSRIHAISDIITTAAKPLTLLRIFNHLITIKSVASKDCPSGYIVEVEK
jgi:SAM-dependent methyltransferase